MDKELYKKLLLSVVGLCCFGLAFYFLFCGKSSMPGVIIGGIVAMPFLYGGGICFGLIFSPALADRLTDILYLPRRYLDRPPELLSPLRGLIEQECYQEAIAGLIAILDRQPFNPEATLLLAEVYLNRTGEERKGAKLILDYFADTHLTACEENIMLLLLYCDYCSEKRADSTQSVFLLKQELSRRGYTTPQRKLLQNRLDNLPFGEIQTSIEITQIRQEQRP